MSFICLRLLYLLLVCYFILFIFKACEVGLINSKFINDCDPFSLKIGASPQTAGRTVYASLVILPILRSMDQETFRSQLWRYLGDLWLEHQSSHSIALET